MRLSRLVFLAVLAVPAAAMAQPACPAPRNMRFEPAAQIRRSDLAFTEGLEMHGGALWESSGDLFGTSRIERIDPASGKATTIVDAGHQYFGEGLTFFDGRIYQMTWREHDVYVRDLKGKVLRELKNPREGWGLTHDATRLIASDGGDRLFFIRPSDFATLGSVQVREGARPVSQINELEYVDGVVYANVFETWQVLKIAPATGCVLAVADLSGLRDRMNAADRDLIDSEGNFVLNGIAHDPAGGAFFVTGKDWPVLFRGRFVDEAP